MRFRFLSTACLVALCCPAIALAQGNQDNPGGDSLERAAGQAAEAANQSIDANNSNNAGQPNFQTPDARVGAQGQANVQGQQGQLNAQGQQYRQQGQYGQQRGYGQPAPYGNQFYGGGQVMQADGYSQQPYGGVAQTGGYGHVGGAMPYNDGRTYVLHHDHMGREFICVHGQRVYFDDGFQGQQGYPQGNQPGGQPPQMQQGQNQQGQNQQGQNQQGQNQQGQNQQGQAPPSPSDGSAPPSPPTADQQGEDAGQDDPAADPNAA